MANNRQILPLTELAFNAFLRARKDLDFETTPSSDTVIEGQILNMAPLFLKCIADANLDEVKKFLENCPELAVMARGTVTTASGYTYENVSAVQLAYLMDDVEMCDMMLPYIKDLSEDMIKKWVMILLKR